jgi:hypothetical protein
MTTQPSPPRRRGLTEEAADASIDQACRMLRLPTIWAQFPETADGATRQQLSYRAFLAELLLAATRLAAAPVGRARHPR